MQTGDPSGDSLFWPVVDGVKQLKPLQAFPSAYQRIDPVFWGPKQAQIVTWFDTAIK